MRLQTRVALLLNQLLALSMAMPPAPFIEVVAPAGIFSIFKK